MPANQSIYDLVLSFTVSSEKSLRHIPHQAQLSASKKMKGSLITRLSYYAMNMYILDKLRKWVYFLKFL